MNNLASVKIIANPYMPKDAIVVHPDMFEIIKQIVDKINNTDRK